MHRFYLPQPEFLQDSPLLGKEEARHATQVLRLEAGDKLTVFDGLGSESSAVVLSAERGEVRLQMGPRQRTEPLPCSITLAQAIPKGKNMELILQKAVEIGASRVVPVLSDRTVVQLDPAECERKQQKWQAIAVEACKQCGQNRIPQIASPVSMSDFLKMEKPPQLPLIASLQPDARRLKEVLQEVCSELGHRPSVATILIGPEGDFTPAETAAAKSHGYLPVTLGPVILRTETAAIYSLSVLAHELF